FFGDLESVISYEGCDHKSSTVDPFLDLSLDLVPNIAKLNSTSGSLSNNCTLQPIVRLTSHTQVASVASPSSTSTSLSLALSHSVASPRSGPEPHNLNQNLSRLYTESVGSTTMSCSENLSQSLVFSSPQNVVTTSSGLVMSGGTVLNTSGKTSLSACLAAYFQPELIDGLILCSHCKIGRPAVKQFSLLHLPNVLCFYLKQRCHHDTKINISINFPAELDLAPFLSQVDGDRSAWQDR
ncbi:unnamed protein product, partial [Protopolystoma xenopodis]